MSLFIRIFAKFMDKFHFRNKILILLLIITLLLLAPFSVVFYLQGRQIEKNIQKQAELKLNILSHSFLHFQNLLNSYNSIITTNNKLKQDLYFYQKTGTYEKNKFEESIIPIYKTLQVDILNLYDSNSRVMLRSHQSVFFDIIKDRYLEETIKTKKYQAVIKRHKNPKTSETNLVVIAYSPVLFNDKLVGVCAIGYHLETLIHRLKNLVGEELILSHKSEFLASSIKDAVEYEVNVEESKEKAINSGYIKARSKSNKSNISYDASYLPFKTISKSQTHSQKPLIVSSDVLDLGIYLLVDNHILKSNLKRLELINYIIIGSILIIVVIIAFLFAETIKKPIHEVVRGFHKLAEKDLSTQLQITSNDEMGDLSKSFNILALELKTHIESLDSLVKERTRELEEKNQEIMKSIYYAKNIQTSILPPKNKLSDKFKEHFVIWKPKDEVGGDFYFFKEMEDDFLVGVVDCTGHGVPGAFMAMAASSTLDRITDHIKNPAEILKELNISIRRTLNQNDPSDSSRIDDGMDIILCHCDLKTRALTYAGANIPLFVFKNGEIICLPSPDRQGIGFYESREDYQYKNKELNLEKNDIVYLTSDGFLEQSGEEGKFPFGRKRFTLMLEKNPNNPLENQKTLFERVLRDFQGTVAQRDDITVIAFKF